MTHRQPKLPLALRIIAAACVVLWLAGVSACSLEALLCCDSHGHTAVAHADGGHTQDAEQVDADTPHAHDADAHHSNDADAHHSHDAEGHSHDSNHHGGKEGSCCSTLKAIVHTVKPIVITKPALPSVAFLCVLLEARIAALSAPGKASDRPPPSGEWVLTPEVCTGPANRAHAPPVFI